MNIFAAEIYQWLILYNQFELNVPKSKINFVVKKDDSSDKCLPFEALKRCQDNLHIGIIPNAIMPNDNILNAVIPNVVIPNDIIMPLYLTHFDIFVQKSKYKLAFAITRLFKHTQGDISIPCSVVIVSYHTC